MMKEHAAACLDEIDENTLQYLILKANEIGFSGREIYRVYSETIAHKRHIYFEVEPLKGPQ